MQQIAKIQNFDTATPRIELSRYSGSIQRALALGFPVLVRVQVEDDLFRREMKPDNAIKGWYKASMVTIQEVDEMFKGYHVTYFMAWTLESVIRADYNADKPHSATIREVEIATDLLNAGIEIEIAAFTIGWFPEEVPYIYASRGHVSTSGSLGKYEGKQVLVELWIGTRVPVQAISANFDDQTMDVLTQWWGHTYEDGFQEISRLEITPLTGNRFIEREYRNVSAMGQFDGDLWSISVHIPEDREWIFDGKLRHMWRIYPVNIRGTATLDLAYTNVGGATVLNGLGQLKQFHRGSVYAVKGPLKIEQFESGNSLPVQFFKS